MRAWGRGSEETKRMYDVQGGYQFFDFLSCASFLFFLFCYIVFNFILLYFSCFCFFFFLLVSRVGV